MFFAQCMFVRSVCSMKALPSDFPPTTTLSVHFESIVKNNFDPFREPLLVRFPACDKPHRALENFEVKYVDGFTKGLIGQLIVAIVDQLATCQSMFNLKVRCHVTHASLEHMGGGWQQF
ncbi:unnamed protein product [Symbiodinium natans]|uniref:Uncharacterized protein n=1 Tax=Symbiodinium natans TaxID=878477 RepID=A0A812N4E2_9DINO|nr:unnamed protein product [Symbiodinium natans]